MSSGRRRATAKTAMLTAQENAILTETGPDAPMGAVFRRHWMPALPPRELPVPDCPPLRMKLLGEDFVAFRDSAGPVGIVAPGCPHRGASLFFGRVEDCGIRCAYHGWTFDARGACVDIPTLPDAAAQRRGRSKPRSSATSFGPAWGRARRRRGRALSSAWCRRRIASSRRSSSSAIGRKPAPAVWTRRISPTCTPASTMAGRWASPRRVGGAGRLSCALWRCAERTGRAAL